MLRPKTKQNVGARRKAWQDHAKFCWPGDENKSAAPRQGQLGRQLRLDWSVSGSPYRAPKAVAAKMAMEIGLGDWLLIFYFRGPIISPPSIQNSEKR
jgi:hypothetical protein